MTTNTRMDEMNRRIDALVAICAAHLQDIEALNCRIDRLAIAAKETADRDAVFAQLAEMRKKLDDCRGDNGRLTDALESESAVEVSQLKEENARLRVWLDNAKKQAPHLGLAFEGITSREYEANQRRRVMYDCGCSGLKVDANLCDVYAPGGVQRGPNEMAGCESGTDQNDAGSVFSEPMCNPTRHPHDVCQCGATSFHHESCSSCSVCKLKSEHPPF